VPYVYYAHMIVEVTSPRRRNILWNEEADKMAERLAHEYKLKRGVSELLERLIRADSKRKRGIAHLHGDPLPNTEQTTKRRAPRKAGK
jgi:hypothetical protein